MFPQFLADGRHFLFYVSGIPEARGVYVGELDSANVKRLFDSDSPARYLASGSVVFTRGGKLLVQGFDTDRLELTGEPSLVADHVSGNAVVAVSNTGSVAYRTPPADSGQRQLVWVDRSGREIAKEVYADNSAFGLDWSRDGRRIAVYRFANENMDIWSFETSRRVWERLTSGEVTVFTAVPTIYNRLISSWEAASPEIRTRRSDAVRGLRLMMSGSAALPVKTLERWREISGHTLLERYGMTEIGMALSNPIAGERRPGCVGLPLPDVEVRLVDDAGHEVETGTPGELEVRGPSVFLEYWKRPEETAAAFRDGWFRTGDVAVLEDGSYRLLGRTSVDIIKTGGFKVSALEIEEVLRTHPAIAECAVVGISDEDWGECVSAAVELRQGATLSLDDLQQWAKPQLAPYKIPRALQHVSTLPRNAMGKVVKPEVAGLFKSR